MTVEYNVASDCSTQCEVLVVSVFKKWANDEIPMEEVKKLFITRIINEKTSKKGNQSIRSFLARFKT